MNDLEKFYKSLEIKPIDLEYISDSEKAYLNEIQTIPLLTKEEEQKLSLLAFKQDERAKKILLERNLRLVAHIARNFCGYGVSFLDLVQEGNIHLIEIINRFDPKKNCRFSTYAFKAIQRKMIKVIVSQKDGIRTSQVTYRQLKEYNDANQNLKEQLGRNPKIEEIAEYMKVPVERVIELDIVRPGVLSINEPIGTEQNQTVEDFISSNESLEDDLEQKEKREKLIGFLKQNLTEKEFLFLSLKFGSRKYSVIELAKHFGVTHQAISERYRNIYKKIRALSQTKEFAIYMQNPTRAEQVVDLAHREKYQN